MKRIKKPFDYIYVIKYILLFVSFMLANKLQAETNLYSVGIFAAAIHLGFSVAISAITLLAALILQKGFGLLLSAGISLAFLIIIKLVYMKFKVKIKYEITIFTAISLIGYLFIGDTSTETFLEQRTAVTLVSSFLSLACFIGGKAVSDKGLKIKFSGEDYAALAAIAIVVGLGVCNLISPFVWKGICFFIVLCACRLLRFGLGTLIGTITGISLAIFYGDISYAAAIMLAALTADAFTRLSRYAASVSVALCDYLTEIVFGVYGGYTTADFLPVIIASAIFAVIPDKPLSALKDKIEAFREKQLPRAAINRNRLMLSNRLYELSGVFTEMAWAFSAFKKYGSSQERSKNAIAKEILCEICKECPNYTKCRKTEKETENDINKMIDVGFAKGKLSLIDIPAALGNKCVKLNEITYGLNKMLAEYRAYAANAANLATGRQLIAEEAEGVSDILKGLALESGSLLKYQSKTEKALTDRLIKNGFFASEILIYGESENATLCLVLSMKEFSITTLQKIINETVGFSMTLTEKYNITESKCYLSFKKTPVYDAVFGISKVTKDGSEKSGDTHAVSRISDDKFLVALSDGMGSGNDAEAISSVSLSLIESFYKAGMDSALILNTVNKLLSINAEDSFTALDVSVINLKDCSADFIKYGSPYGFIISDGGIRIIEGNTLPLGILEELKPSVCSATLNDGDVIVLTTDGVSDAFGSSQDVIDYLRTVPAKNPQNLSDGILNKALSMSGGRKNDDMSVLAVRVFKKKDYA